MKKSPTSLAPRSSSESTEADKTPRWSQQRRLRFIDFRLQWQERINRNDIRSFFGISVPQASADIKLYTAQAPDNLEYHASSKTYVAGKSFKGSDGQIIPNQVFARIIAIQFVKDGEAFGSGPTSAEGFDEEEVETAGEGASDLF